MRYQNRRLPQVRKLRRIPFLKYLNNLTRVVLVPTEENSPAVWQVCGIQRLCAKHTSMGNKCLELSCEGLSSDPKGEIAAVASAHRNCIGSIGK